MRTLRTLPILLCFGLGLGCAKNDEGDKPAKGEATAVKSVDDKAPPPVADPEPKFDPRTRLFSCEFVAWDGEGEERQAKFALINKSDKQVTRIQSWVYYHDTVGKQIDRYPHALAAKFEPGAKNEQKLGQKGDRLKAAIANVTCEVTEATWSDDAKWENANLNYNRMVIPRPLAGETDAQLIARTGEKVEAKWSGNLDGVGKFTLTNTSDRALTIKTAWIYYYDKSGKQLDRTVANLRLKLEPGASVEKEMGRDKDKLKEGTAVIEVGVSKVEFDGGELWFNRNLEVAKRAMKVAPQ